MNALRRFGTKLSSQNISQFGQKAGNAIRSFGTKFVNGLNTASDLAERAMPIAQALTAGTSFAPLVHTAGVSLHKFNQFRHKVNHINNMIQQA